MQEREKRVHTRVQVSGEVRVLGDGGMLTGELFDLSKGGAGVCLSEKAGEKGTTVELFMQLEGGLEIAVMAEILRVTETDKGLLHGLRFSLVEPAMQESLLNLIESLIDAKGPRDRRHPRIVRRIPIRYGKLADLTATLENISLGGLAMSVNRALVLYEEVEVSIPDTSGRELLILNGRVVNQRPLGDKESDGYRVGIEFKELSEVAKACLKELLNHTINIKDES